MLPLIGPSLSYLKSIEGMVNESTAHMTLKDYTEFVAYFSQPLETFVRSRDTDARWLDYIATTHNYGLILDILLRPTSVSFAELRTQGSSGYIMGDNYTVITEWVVS